MIVVSDYFKWLGVWGVHKYLVDLSVSLLSVANCYVKKLLAHYKEVTQNDLICLHIMSFATWLHT